MQHLSRSMVELRSTDSRGWLSPRESWAEPGSVLPALRGRGRPRNIRPTLTSGEIFCIFSLY
jgi:hypothetical protein